MKDKEFNWDQFLSECNWEVRKIEDIASKVCSGSIPKASEQRKGSSPVIHLKDIHKLKSPFIYECQTFLDDSNIKNKKTATYGDILMVYHGGRKMVGKTFAYFGKCECIVGSCMHVIKHNQNPSYLLHVLNLPNIQKKIKEIAGLTNQMFGLFGSFRLQDLKNISIPIPSLEDQEKIANYLDNLLINKTKLKESLQKMVDLRKKQYEYYKEQILTSEIDKWDVVTISEIAIEIFVGNGVTSEHLGTGKFPAVKNKDLSYLSRQFYECSSFIDPNLIKNKKYFGYGDLLISNMGGKQDVGQACVYLGKDKCLAGNHVIVVKHKQNPQFLAYMLSSKYCRQQISSYAKGVTVQDLKLSDTKQIKIPLPPLEEQERIASLIDQLNFKLEELNVSVQELITNKDRQFTFLSKKIFFKESKHLN